MSSATYQTELPPQQQGHTREGSQAYSTRSTADYLETLIGVLQASKVDFPVFRGDPMQFHAFMRSFNDNVEKMLTSLRSKIAPTPTAMYRRCCQSDTWLHVHADAPKQGYTQARQLLKPD